MLELFAPFWWLALPALAAPVLVHLWSKREPRPIRVGSVRFLEEAVQTKARSLHLSDVPLLLVRFLVVAALIFLLARPHWKSETPADPPEPLRWALVHPDAAADPTTLRTVQQTVDSLVEAGFDPRRLEPGFPPYTGDEDAMVKERSAGFWSLLREADVQLPPGSEIAVVGPARAAAFHGVRPTLSAAVTWRAIPEVRRNHWIETARRVPGDSLLVVVGVGDSLRTFFRRTVFERPATRRIVSENGLPPIEVEPEAGVARLIDTGSFPDDDRRQFAEEKPPLRVAIVHDVDRRTDARYVRVGVEAAADFARLPVSVEQRTVEEAGDAPAGAPLVFWLSERPVPVSLVDSAGGEGRTLVQDGAVGDVQMDSRVVLPAGSPELLRRAPATEAGVPAWTDGFGRPLLVERRVGTVREWTFFSRFHPAWTDLVLDESWPPWLLELLLAQAGETAQSEVSSPPDLRTVAIGQMLPRKHAPDFEREEAFMFRSWHLPLWVLVIVMLSVERWMAFRTSS